MGRKLSQMSTADVQAEMSIAGRPEVITKKMTEIMKIVGTIERGNAAELINMEFALQRILAEVKLWKRQYEKRTGQQFKRS